jgi:hypothetical protein
LLLFAQWLAIVMKEGRLFIRVDDLNIGVRDVAFETKLLNKYGTFDQIVNRTMEYQSYAYLHSELLNRVVLSMIILRVKSPHIEMNEQLLKKRMYVKVEFFCIDSKSKRGFEKGDIHIVIIVDSTTIVSSISSFHLELIPMFFHTNSIRNLEVLFKIGIMFILRLLSFI